MALHNKDKNRGSERPENMEAVTPTELEDLRLARKAVTDRKTAEVVMDRLAPRVRHTVRLLVGRDDEIEDLTHNCLLAIWENLAKYKGTGPLEAWAGQLTYRVLMRQLKRKRRNERTVSLVPEDRGISSANPEGSVASKGMMDRLEEHLQRLPDKRRRALVLRVLYGYSVSEVAQMTEAPLNTVRDRIRVGLKELRTSIVGDPASAELFGRKRGG